MSEAKKGQFLTLDHSPRAGIDTWRQRRTGGKVRCRLHGYSLPYEQLPTAMQSNRSADSDRRQRARPALPGSLFLPNSLASAEKISLSRARSGVPLPAHRASRFSGMRAFDRSEDVD
jgi:hypothetical protein